MSVQCERVYDFKERPKHKNEYAVLVDRVWPRGVKKADLGLDEWAKELAPSTDLRRWFKHDPERWSEFKQRYREELESVPEAVEALQQKAGQQTVTLLFAARDTEHNQALVLAELLNNDQSQG
ncbi:DUF488 family protein [Marinobacteraceae bacterium S3BR75-40.1]